MAKVIGIDLGTSNSAAAFMERDRPTIIPSAEGAGVASGKAFPSYVAFTKDGQKLVGEPARRQASINPEGTIMAAKRKMGPLKRKILFLPLIKPSMERMDHILPNLKTSMIIKIILNLIQKAWTELDIKWNKRNKLRISAWNEREIENIIRIFMPN